ncbi:MAG: helix-turn-helix domain-containing protein [Peptococcaceae bacterium]
MNIANAKEWTLKDIALIIEHNILENKELEFKACSALQDEYKDEISKDVSSFANSAGGVIVYGIKEVEDGRTIRLELDEGYDINDRINKEWLENVIYSRISPKIQGIYINPIEISTGKVIYVVIVPQSTTAHMAGSYRYYKRRNFKSEPMEDYEVRDVMNRQKQPELDLRLNVPREISLEDIYVFRVLVRNVSEIMVKYFAVKICIPEELIDHKNYKSGRKTFIKGIAYREYTKQGDYRQFIFPGFHIFLDNNFLPGLSAQASNEKRYLKIYWTTYMDYQNPQKGSVSLEKIIGNRISDAKNN